MSEPVDVWVVSLDLPDREIEHLLAVLSAQERQRAGDPPLEPRKRQYVVRQAALAGEPGLRFSVSDSSDLALVAVADREVGVDVERIRDRPAAARAAALGIDRFYERWTMLEATGKALGTGLRGACEGVGITCSALDVGPDFAAAVAVAADEVEVRLYPY
jgi:hypothetical protein